MSHAIIVVDVQNDFCEGGALAVAGGAGVATAISEWLGEAPADFVIATRDHHIDPGAHFSDHPNYVDSWPRHCVAGTPGEQLHPNLRSDRIAAVFDKGEYDDGYSGFLGATKPAEPAPQSSATKPAEPAPESSATKPAEPVHRDSAGAGVSLADWLRERGVRTLEIVGIATDHCVRATALDAAAAGFETTVRLDLTAGVSRTTTDGAVKSMHAAGIRLKGEPVVLEK